jgi:hypothetical protein
MGKFYEDRFIFVLSAYFPDEEKKPGKPSLLQA